MSEGTVSSAITRCLVFCIERVEAVASGILDEVQEEPDQDNAAFVTSDKERDAPDVEKSLDLEFDSELEFDDDDAEELDDIEETIF